MSYYLHDINGYVGDLASTHALNLLSDFALAESDSETVKQFFIEGHSPITPDLIDGIKSLSSGDRDIQITLDNLVLLLGKSKEVAIITDGMTA
ncbi:hypothetical protein ABFB09_05970 [Dehalogenimonas sp. THU2]|uniref:hypothetical protein n=1 Tax=Dehalogenimonas sp. THU2 TaxID=3151121 RepID=UPI0032185074